MAARPRSKGGTTRIESYTVSSTVVGPAFTMPDLALEMLASIEEAPIDFQARQDRISPTRRTPGTALAPKLKRTSAKPSKAKETPVKL